MLKQLIILIILSINFSKIFCQVEVSGKVISGHDTYPLAGATILEKGTQNGTATNSDGTFLLHVIDLNSILIVSSVGFETKEIELNGKNTIEIKLKESCSHDWFDHQQIGFYAVSGVINDPVGGQINLSFPAFYKQTTLKTIFNYQTNFNTNRFSNAAICLSHFAVSCNFNADARGDYHKVSFGDKLNSKSFSIQTDLNFRYLKFIVGYSTIDFTNLEKTTQISSAGPLLGIGAWLGRRNQFFIDTRISCYKNLIECQADLNKSFRKLNAFLRFYKIDAFNELSIGVGKDITYRFRK